MSNSVKPQKLFIFQDGPNEETVIEKWNEVNAIIHAVDFCETKVVVSEQNKGLASSLVDGISSVFQEYDAVIVLEDDCVPAPGFMEYMSQSLNYYEKANQVYSISGYAWPISVKKDEYDTYFTGRESTWGWGTWKNRWEQFEKDYTIYKKLKYTREGSENLALWGSDIEPVLIGNVTGQTDSWGLFWGLKIIEKKGLCLAPYESLINNIGNDGSGVHCGTTNDYDVQMNLDINKNYRFPDMIEVRTDVKTAFAGLFGSYTATNMHRGEKDNVIIYGLGTFFLSNEKDINKDNYIVSFFDLYKKGFFAGKDICKSIGTLSKYEYEKILIMVREIKDCFDICNYLISGGVNPEKIEFGIFKYGDYKNKVNEIAVNQQGQWVLNIKNKEFIVNNKEEFESLFLA